MDRVWYRHYEKGVAQVLIIRKPLYSNCWTILLPSIRTARRSSLVRSRHKLPGATPDGRPKMSYRDSARGGESFCKWTRQNGCEKGRPGSHLFTQFAQFAIAFYGMLKAGGVIAPVNPIYTPRELEFIFQDSGPRQSLRFRSFTPNCKRCGARPGSRM